jgi:23S rRNA (cytosine1962-C5)-methyltransferase
VYRDGVIGSVEVGEPVELVDGRGRPVAWGLFDEGTIAVRVLGREPCSIAEILATRLAVARRRRSLVGGETDAWRLCNGEGDGLGGLVVDRYGPVAVVRLYARAWEKWLADVVNALEEPTVYRRFGVERVDGREGGEVLRGPAPPDVLVVREHGMKLLVRVRTGQKTGLFLDQREHRRMVRGWASGRTVANLFSYNGGFSVAAALGGATRVVSVDQSQPALDDAREIFRLNGLDPGAHGFECGDAFTWSGCAELIVVDPPSLAQRREAEAGARGAYKRLHRQVAACGPRFVVSSSCTARLSRERWEEAVREGLGAGWAWLAVGGESVDHPVLAAHPEGRYLKFGLLGRG